MDKTGYCLRLSGISRKLSGYPAPLPLSPTSVLYKIDLGEAPFSLQTMRNETHKKARWRSAIKKKGGERARERGRESERAREVKHYRGKESRVGKSSFVRSKWQVAARQATQHCKPRTVKTNRRRATPGGKGKKQSAGALKRRFSSIPVSSSKGSTCWSLQMKFGVADNKVGWRFAAVPHCKAAVAQSRL